jgi:hypothetical protein
MSNVLEMPSRTETVKTMAKHLMAAIVAGRLNTSSEIQIIDCLRKTPEQYNWKIIHSHMDEALFEAKQALSATEWAKP